MRWSCGVILQSAESLGHLNLQDWEQVEVATCKWQAYEVREQ